MSLSASTLYDMESNDAAASSKSNGAAPRLTAANAVAYAMWAPLFTNWCKNGNNSRVLTKEIKDWTVLHAAVQQWESDREDAVLQAGLASMQAQAAGGSASSSKAAAAAPAVDAQAVALKKMVNTSERVHAALYGALPEELRKQVPGPDGYAFGLWAWLRAKFQSTTRDSIGRLYREWCHMRMQEDESFDAYRARVNTLHELLVAAKQEPKPEFYVYVLLDCLPPRYEQTVIALTMSGKLDDASKVDWDEVTAHVNAGERKTALLNGNDGEAPMEKTMSLQGSWKRSGSSGGGGGQSGEWKKKMTCFGCGKKGHLKAECRQQHGNGGGQRRGAGQYGGEAAKARRRRLRCRAPERTMTRTSTHSRQCGSWCRRRTRSARCP